MKRILSIISIFAFLLILCACGSNTEEENAPTFTAKVLEKYEGSCLVEVTDKGNNALNEGDLIVVSTRIDDCPEYAVGDHLKIIFDGAIAESYPMQVNKVYSIKKVDAT